MEPEEIPSPQILDLDDAALFAGGRLCLDFVNTACELRGAPIEFLGTPEALQRWLQIAERIYRRPLIGEASSLPQALKLRSALRELVDSAIEGHAPSAVAIKLVNATLRANPAYEQLEYGEGHFARTVTPGNWLSEIARDAVDFLGSGDLSLLKECECETCIRVFYDTTKNHRRRWCVEKCGSRVKSAAYYRRKRAAKSE